MVASKGTRAEVLLPTDELRNDLPFYTQTLGMQLDSIYPADDPTCACLSGHGLNIRIDKAAKVPNSVLRKNQCHMTGYNRWIALNAHQLRINVRTPNH